MVAHKILVTSPESKFLFPFGVGLGNKDLDSGLSIALKTPTVCSEGGCHTIVVSINCFTVFSCEEAALEGQM